MSYTVKPFDQERPTIYEAEFAVGDRVIIPDMDNSRSIVERIMFGHDGVRYEVSWFAAGARQTAWVQASEIRAAERN